MRIYLDTSQIINLIERGTAGISPADFRAFLIAGNHTIVCSFVVICELSNILWSPKSNVVVTRTLNTFEEFPLEWIDLVRLHNLEVSRALRCFKAGRPYEPVVPFVGRFVDTIENAPREINLYLNYRLSEAVFDLWGSGQFDYRSQNASHVAAFRKLMAQERDLLEKMKNPQAARRELFLRKIAERIVNYRLYSPEDKNDQQLFRGVAETIYGDPSWCPCFHISFEIFHQIVNNIGDQLDDGDLNDLIHLWALPYMDVLTTDRRIAGYVQQVSTRLRTNWHEKLCRSVLELVGRSQRIV